MLLPPACLYLAPAVKEHHEVTVSFQLPCLRPNYPNKPEHYLSHLVGHEGPGSLLSALKSRGWALELCAGIDDDGYSFNTAAYLFTVNIVLTEAGLAAGPGFGLAPVGLLFQYLRLLSDTGPQQWVYDELSAISNMKFRFMEEEDSCDFVTRLAATMGWVEPQHLLVADYLHENWQPERVTELLGMMLPTNSNYRIDLLTKSFEPLKQQLLEQQQGSAATAATAGADGSSGSSASGGSVTSLHEPWFEMEAVKWQLPASLTGGWASADVSADLALPPPNPYVPTDFTLKGVTAGGGGQMAEQQQTPPAGAGAAGADADAQQQQQQQQQQKEIASLPAWLLSTVGGRPSSVSVLLSTPPHMVVDKPGVRLWHKLAVRYGQPRLVTYWRLSSPTAAATARHSVLCALWLRLVEEGQAEEGYLADVAGLHWSSGPEGLSGLEVRLDGFSHKLHVLAQKVFGALATAQVKAESFPSVHEELSRRYRNALLKPSVAANALRLQLLSGGPCWSHDELAEALAGVKRVEEVQAFASSFLSSCHLEGLVMGNATAAEAVTLCSDVAAILNNTQQQQQQQQQQEGQQAAAASASGGLTLAAAARPAEVCMQLPQGVEMLHTAAMRNPDEDNCCVEVYYQVGLSSEDLRLRVLTDLVEQVVSEPLYDTLRTKQQLGYTVSSGARLTHGVTGFCVVVVSAAFDAATVEARIEAFLADYQQGKLQSMSEEEFSRHKTSLASNKLQSDMSLGQEGDRAWEQVFSGRYEFVSREQEAAQLEGITLQDLQAFYATYIAPSSTSRRKLCVRVVPTSSKVAGKAAAAAAAAAAGDEQPPQEHVQHEFGVVHAHHHAAHGAAAQHTKGDERDDGGADADAAAAGGSRKRARRGQQDGTGDAAAAAATGGGDDLRAVQAAAIQEVPDVKGFRASQKRYGHYSTVRPELSTVLV